MRSGVEIWDEAEKVRGFQDDLVSTTQHFFARFGEETVNTADVVGVFEAATMSDYTRRKNGQWKCNEGGWHEKNTKCDCTSRENRERNAEWDRRVKECGKCQGGTILLPSGSSGYCECVRLLVGRAKEEWNTEPV